MWISLPLLAKVDVLKGKEDAKVYIEERISRLAPTNGPYTLLPQES